METVVEVVSEDQFRVHCISTGGRVLNMSITGPHGVVSPLSDIQAVGTQTWMGNDSYSGVSGTLAGADDGDTYNCTASNGVSSVHNSSAEIRGMYLGALLCCFWYFPFLYSCQQTSDRVTGEGVPQ